MDTPRDAQGHFISQTSDIPQPNTPENPKTGEGDPADNPLNHTVTYGSDANHPKATQPTETAQEFAERGVVEKHGQAIRQSPLFKSLVEEEKRQIAENIRNTKGM